MTLRMVDLARQRAALEPGLSATIARVLDHGAFVGGPEVAAFERRLANLIGVAEVVACANGTDALQLALRAEGIGPGDAVIVPALTFAATAEAVALCGAVPVFADVRDTDGTLCPDSVSGAIGQIRREGRLQVRAVIAVDLFGLPADAAALSAICAAQGLLHVTDAAHSIGTRAPDWTCGACGDVAATSFFPSKALGCYGDGGAVMTQDASRAARLRGLRNHGVAAGSALHGVLGTNSRLDTIQAAILLAKLDRFEAESMRRHEICTRYMAAFGAMVRVPAVAPGVTPVWSYFAIRHDERDALQAHLDRLGVPSVAYYRTPTHLNAAFAAYPRVQGGLPVTMAFAGTLLCLPAHAYLTDEEVDRVISAVLAFDG